MLSVIVPIYGVEKYLSEALDSLVRQELEDVEFLLICDGSSDHSPEIAAEFAKKDSRFRLITKPNEGYGATCNLGIQEAKGDYIAIFEPDDYLSQNMYRVLYAFAKEYNVDIVSSNFIQVKNHSLHTNPGFLRCISDPKSHTYIRGIRPIGPTLFYGESSAHRLCFNVFETFSANGSIWAKLYKRSFLEEKQIRLMTTPGATFQDFPFYVETFTKARTFLFVNETHYYYRIHSNNSVIKLFRGPYCYIHLDLFFYLLENQKILKNVPEYAIPSYYRAFLWQYLWALKKMQNLLKIWHYSSKMSEWLSQHPWKTDETFSDSEREILEAYHSGHALSQFFYTLKAVVFHARPKSFLAHILSLTQKILTSLRIIQKF